MKVRFFALPLILSFTAAGAFASDAAGDSVPNRKPYELWERTPAPNRGADFSTPTNGRGYPFDEDWQRWSYPLGNGNLGANVFGRTDTERIQLTEKTIANGSAYGRGGVTNAAELYLDFGQEDISNYRRSLSLDDAIATVLYESGGTTFRREYFTSYPDDVMVIRLTADRPGALTFTVRPDIPYLESKNELDRKTGTVKAKGDTITLAGTVDYYQVNYEFQIRVLNEGGSLHAEGSTIQVKDADAVTLLVAAGTNYRLSPELFLNEPKKKLDPNLKPHEAVTEKMRRASELRFAALKERHLGDYRQLFTRVKVNLSSEGSKLPTSELLAAYQGGEHNTYLDQLMFQYGRYLLIASSRENTLPAHLQGAWSQYESSPWCGGYWHNINVQMNYWGAMNTDLAETFKPYIDYYNAYRPLAERFASEYVQELRPELYSSEPGGNGWIIGTGANAYQISGRSTHSGPGTGGFTSQMFMDYYDFTQDKEFLRETGYPALLGMSRFFDKVLHESKDGKLLVRPSASPEIKHNGEFYITEGCTFDQGFVWENHNNVLRAAAALGKEEPFLEVIKAQLPRLDPIQVGSSGQIKEFREEEAYGDIGDPKHRHISHLCPLYPGTLISSAQPEWMRAASKTLDLRGDETTGWALAHRMNCWARLKEGDKAHAVFRKFIRDKTMPNLWANHPPFQIDGNFGVMAGIAEMLLQSHEGYIEPLPALPEAWKSGSFEGLVARGNFKVSAEWKEGVITALSVVSRSGGSFRIRVPGVAGVLDKNGVPILFESNGPDLVSFPTEKGMTYTIIQKP